MFKTDPRRKRNRLVWVVVLLGATMPICLFVRSLNSASASAKDHHIPADLRARAEAAALQAATRAATTNFTPSLEMKENVDFLLTPALLVQEAMSDDLIITYPSE
jgi:hypothetical protein